MCTQKAARPHRPLATLCLLPLLSALLYTAPAAAQGTCTPGSATALLDVNNVRVPLYNQGAIGYPDAGGLHYEVPKYSGANAIFAMQLRIGGYVDGTLRVATATYAQFGQDHEFFPGPLDAQGQPPPACTAFDRLYRVSRADLDRYEATGQATDDLRDWPVALGAPVTDSDGVAGNYDLAAGDRPALVGDEMVWWVMNDAAGPHKTTKTAPLHLEARVTAYAYDTGDALDNTTFYRYRLTYRGTSPLEDAYFGYYVDVDLGNYTDDYVGSDPALDLGYVYNGDEVDEGVGGYGDRPPAAGIVFLQGPKDEHGTPRGMDYFLFHEKGNGMPWAGEVNAEHYYGYLKGRYRDGSPITVGGNGHGGDTPTAFSYPGMPPSFWSEDNVDGQGKRNTPADRRVVLSTGPFSMQPGETEEIVVAVVWSQGLTRLHSVERLKEDAALVHAFFAGNHTPAPVPTPPAQVPVLTGPADRAVVDTVRLRWEPVGAGVYYDLEYGPPGNTRTVYPTAPDRTLASMQLPEGEPYVWRVRARNAGGAGPWSAWQTFFVADPDQPLPLAFALGGTFPNPASGRASVSLDVPAFATVEAAVYDLLGRRVLMLAPHEVAPGPGRTLDLDASALAAGVYVYRVTARTDDGAWQGVGRLVVAR